MSLLTTYGAHNRVEEQSLDIRYKKTRISGQWSWSAIATPVGETFYYMWECHRYATKSFRYVGMDKTTANACREALKAVLTRNVRQSIWDGTVQGGQWLRQSGGQECMSDVTVNAVAGDMYEVRVTVNEDDVCLAKITANPNPSTLFAMENARAYDIQEPEPEPEDAT